MDGDIENVWQDIELRIYPEPFCTSGSIYSMNKKASPKTPFKAKKPLKWVLCKLFQQHHKVF